MYYYSSNSIVINLKLFMDITKKVPEYKSRDFLIFDFETQQLHIVHFYGVIDTSLKVMSFYFFNGSAILAAKNCLFILAMLVTEMPFGHSAIQA